MSNYELTLILPAEAAKDEAAAKALVSGKVKKTQVWGVKDLAYAIKGQIKGFYIWFELELDPEKVAVLDQSLRQNETVLRHLLISQSK